MAKNDRDLFDRLRHAGIRKQMARTLSEIGEGATKKAAAAARSSAAELRGLAEEIERRLPGVGAPKAKPAASAEPPQEAAGPPRAAEPDATTAEPAGPAATETPKAPEAPAAEAPAAEAEVPVADEPAMAAAARAPRGQNRARILESLQSGPKTASQVAAETGIGTGTVSSTLTKLSAAGEVVKAARGYGLPG